MADTISAYTAEVLMRRDGKYVVKYDPPRAERQHKVFDTKDEAILFLVEINFLP